MDLFSVLLNMAQFPEQNTLYVAQPWTLESETQVIEVEDAHPFIQIDHQVLAYFLEVAVVDELLISLEQHNLCLRAAGQHIIEFALKQSK